MLLVPGNYVISNKIYRVGFPIIIPDGKSVRKVNEIELQKIVRFRNGQNQKIQN